MSNEDKWPKKLPKLTAKQRRISDDFVKRWHEKLPRFSWLENFNHGYVVKHSPKKFLGTLEIGIGLGEHLNFERLSRKQLANYTGVDIRTNMIDQVRKLFPKVKAIEGDAQKKLPFPHKSFDRVIAIHVLEHLPNLPSTVTEVYRLCKSSGSFLVAIPCEGGLLYQLARRMSAQRLFENLYKQKYDWFIKREHINLPSEILAELEPYFEITDRTFYPFLIPIININLVVGLTLKPRAIPLSPERQKDHISLIGQALNTPWKVPLEILRYIYHPLVILYLRLLGVRVGRNTKWYGFPIVFRHKDSRIVIGDRVEVRNWRFSNPLGINHPLVLTTWNKNAVIEIKADTGISGGIICSAKSIVIGPSTLVGANCSIIDTNFHPTSQGNRRYSKKDVKASSVKIGRNVFIGMNSQIIKGVVLGNNSVVGAGSVVFNSFPANSLVLGNPAKLVKRLTKNV